MTGNFQRIIGPVAAAALLAACSTVEKAPAGEAAYALMPSDPQAEDYALHPGDVVRIQVYHEPGLSLEDAEVDAAGALSLPLAGRVPVAGLSASQAAGAIGSALERYLVRPQVTLFVKKAVERRVTVEGEVRNPGLYPLEGRITLLQAVALAGGASRAAKMDQVIVVRQIDGQRQAARFDLGAIRKGQAADPAIQPGDMVLVGLSALKVALGGALLAAPAIAAGFVALDRDR